MSLVHRSRGRRRQASQRKQWKEGTVQPEREKDMWTEAEKSTQILPTHEEGKGEK